MLSTTLSVGEKEHSALRREGGGEGEHTLIQDTESAEKGAVVHCCEAKCCTPEFINVAVNFSLLQYGSTQQYSSVQCSTSVHQYSAV